MALRRWGRGRIAALRKSGAALDEAGVRFQRRARWWAPLSGVLLLGLAFADERWWAMALFGALGVNALCVVWPAAFVMLDGHRRREEIDTRGAERCDAVAIGTGAVAGAALVPLLRWGELNWPLW